MHVLVTGFEPFGGETINPSWEVARALDGEAIASARVQALRLPCRFGEDHGATGSAHWHWLAPGHGVSCRFWPPQDSALAGADVAEQRGQPARL